MILVSPRIESSKWMDLRINSPDVTGIQIWAEFGTLRIFNIYNDGDHSHSTETLQKWYRDPEKVSYPKTPCFTPKLPVHTVWLGDFNRHHPMWEEERNHHLFTSEALNKAQPLLNLIAKHRMEMTLPKNMPTLEASNTKNWTRPDNIFMSGKLASGVIRCEADAYRRLPKADHLPIITEIDVEPSRTEETLRRNWNDIDWEEFLTGHCHNQLIVASVSDKGLQ